ncbi:MAG: glycosyltransferase family 1 protein [Geodermatophilaceae bacterium]
MPTLQLHAHVQADAVGELADGVRAIPHAISAGVRRAAVGLGARWPADLVHGLDVDLPLAPGAPTVTTVHDLSVYDAPWAHSRLRGSGERMLVRHALHRADAVIAVSAFTAERVATRFQREVTVTSLAPRRDLAPASPEQLAEVRRRYRLPERHVLQVGSVEPRKEVELLAGACRELGVPLVLAGVVHPDCSVPSSARHLGYVPEADLPALYGAATVVAYCSRYEGFGLPPVEALACGAPVIASRVGALPEVLGTAAVLVPPTDHDALVAGLRELLADDDRRGELGRSGLTHAAGMSWANTAQATLGVYRNLGVAC